MKYLGVYCRKEVSMSKCHPYSFTISFLNIVPTTDCTKESEPLVYISLPQSDNKGWYPFEWNVHNLRLKGRIWCLQIHSASSRQGERSSSSYMRLHCMQINNAPYCRSGENRESGLPSLLCGIQQFSCLCDLERLECYEIVDHLQKRISVMLTLWKSWKSREPYFAWKGDRS